MTYGVSKSVMHASLHIFPWKKKMTEKFYLRKSEYIKVKSTWKEAKWAIAQHFTFLGNGIIEASSSCSKRLFLYCACATSFLHF